MKLLIVDDSNIIRNRITRVTADPRLKSLVAIGTAGDGRTAVEIFTRMQPDLVTMDLTMPGMDGIACIEAMMKLNSEVKILVVSALSDKTTAIKALKKGAQGFLYKPFTDEQLIDAFIQIVN